jgi:hypothetical protein
MSDPEPREPASNPALAASERALFAAPAPEAASSAKTPWIVAAAVVLLVLGGIVLTAKGHRTDAAVNQILQPLAPEASSLAISDVAMSESTSFSGGKSTFIDGVIHNNGTKTLTGATVQVIFANDEQLPPEIETLPLSLIRTRQPYVDTEPVSAEPIAPGGQAEFRLIFEGVGANWNQQVPAIHIVKIATR